MSTVDKKQQDKNSKEVDHLDTHRDLFHDEYSDEYEDEEDTYWLPSKKDKLRKRTKFKNWKE